MKRFIKIGKIVLGKPKPEPIEDKISKGIIELEKIPDKKDSWFPTDNDYTPIYPNTTFVGTNTGFPRITTVTTGTGNYYSANSHAYADLMRGDVDRLIRDFLNNLEKYNA